MFIWGQLRCPVLIGSVTLTSSHFTRVFPQEPQLNVFAYLGLDSLIISLCFRVVEFLKKRCIMDDSIQSNTKWESDIRFDGREVMLEQFCKQRQLLLIKQSGVVKYSSRGITAIHQVIFKPSSWEYSEEKLSAKIMVSAYFFTSTLEIDDLQDINRRKKQTNEHAGILSCGQEL